MSEFGQWEERASRSQMVASPTQRRIARQREVARFYLRRQLFNQAVPIGAPALGPVTTESVEKVVLQKDLLNVVGNHGAQSGGTTQVQVTRDADGGMRMWAASGGGGGGSGNSYFPTGW